VVDNDRIWFNSRNGVDVDHVDGEPGLCASAILQNEPRIIQDARTDSRALSNPLVAGELGLQFYAGIPLRTRDGYNLGTLCIAPRT
jgi:eukaryotic-like serine/threonine-protein kinase